MLVGARCYASVVLVNGWLLLPLPFAALNSETSSECSVRMHPISDIIQHFIQRIYAY